MIFKTLKSDREKGGHYLENKYPDLEKITSIKNPLFTHSTTKTVSRSRFNLFDHFPKNHPNPLINLDTIALYFQYQRFQLSSINPYPPLTTTTKSTQSQKIGCKCTTLYDFSLFDHLTQTPTLLKIP